MERLRWLKGILGLRETLVESSDQQNPQPLRDEDAKKRIFENMTPGELYDVNFGNSIRNFAEDSR